MGIYTEAVQKLYVAYFNRPADVAGLTYWENVVANAKGSTAAVSAAFSTSAEYKAAYAGMDAGHVVAQVYQNLFGHGPDTAGLNFWTQALLTNALTVDNVVTGIAAGAQGTDATAYKDKVAAATSFTLALDTADKQLAYSGDKANNVGKMFIASVTDDASLAAVTATAALAQTISDVVAAAPQVVGTTYTLTAGLDNFPGTAGNDVFNALSINPTTGAFQNNLSSFDVLDGGAGKDTLNIQIQTATVAGVTSTYNSLAGLTAVSKNIETVNITADAASVASVDASLFAGATQINQNGPAVGITKLAATTTAGFNGFAGGADSTHYATLAVGAAGASAAVSFSNVGEFTNLAVSGSKLASVTVSGARSDTDAGGSIAGMTLTANIGVDVQSLTVNTNQKTTLVAVEDGTSTKHLKTVDASASTGAITFDASAMTNVATINTGSAGDTIKIGTTTAAATSSAAAVNASVSSGAGNDIITVTTTGTGLTTVDAGAGDDSVTVTKVTGAGLSITGGDGNDTVTLKGAALEVTDVIDGAAGTDTVSMGGSTASRTADDFIVFNKLLKNFETIKFSTAEGSSATVAFDASKLAANYTTINMFDSSFVKGVGSQALIANGSLTATAAGYLADDGTGSPAYAGTLNITENGLIVANVGSGTINAMADVVNLTVKSSSGSTGGAVATTLAGDVQTANVTLTNSVDSTSSPTVDRVTTLTVNNSATLAGLSSLTLSGNGSANVTNAAGTSLTSVDASALGGTLTVGGTSSMGLTYSSMNTKVETIKLGSGIDNITIGASTYGKVDTITGLNLVAKSDLSGLTASSDQLHVTGVATTVKVFTTAQTDLDLALKEAAVSSKGDDLVFTMNGDTYIYHDAAGVNNGVVDSGDIVVKLTGTPDIKAVILALGGTPA
jgi:trimeric autotransporter adhesin